MVAVAHQLQLPPGARAVPPTSRRQVKKAEHSGQHDKRQRASQGTHARTRSIGVVRGPAHTHCRSHPAALTPGSACCSRPGTPKQQSASKEHQQARSNDTDGSKGSTAHATCQPRHTHMRTSSLMQGHTQGKEYIRNGQTATHSLTSHSLQQRCARSHELTPTPYPA